MAVVWLICAPIWGKLAGKKPSTFGDVLAVCCFWAMICPVAVVSGGGGVGGGGRMLPSLRKACAHTNTHASAHRLMHGQCWLQMLAKNVWRANNESTQTTRLQHRGGSCMDRGWQSLQVYMSTQLHSNVFRYTHSLFGGIGF